MDAPAGGDRHRGLAALVQCLVLHAGDAVLGGRAAPAGGAVVARERGGGLGLGLAPDYAAADPWTARVSEAGPVR